MHKKTLFRRHKDFLKTSFYSPILRNATYKQRTCYLKWNFPELKDVSPSTVQRVCNQELNFTHKKASNVAI